MRKIITLVLLLCLFLPLVAVSFSSCGGDEKTYSFDYIGEDLTKYVAISPTDYKGYTLTVKLGAITVTFNYQLVKTPDSVKEALASLDRRRAPRSGFFKIAYKHLIKAHGIGTVTLDNIIGVNDVAARL